MNGQYLRKSISVVVLFLKKRTFYSFCFWIFDQNTNFILILQYRKGKLYLVFEFVEKTLLEILEERTSGIQGDLVRKYIF